MTCVHVSTPDGYPGHVHSFEGVLHALLDGPAGFSIEGFEEYYSVKKREKRKAVKIVMSERRLKTIPDLSA